MTKFTVSPTVNTYTTQLRNVMLFILPRTYSLSAVSDINFNNMLQVSQLQQCTANT